MHPIFLRIGSFVIHWYGVCMAAGFVCFLLTLQHFGKGTRRTGDYISNLVTLLIVSAIGGARAAYVIEHWTSGGYATNFWSVFNIREGGLMFYGGLLCCWAAITGFVRCHKERYFDFLDFLVTALPIGHACGRVGCFLEGCCFGALTDGPLGVHYPIGSHLWTHQVEIGLIDKASAPLPVYPSQLFEAGLLVMLYVVLFRLYRRRRFEGQSLATYFVGYAVIRYVIELFRSDVRAMVGPFTISQFISVCLFVFGAGLWIVGTRSKRLRIGREDVTEGGTPRA